MREFANGNRKSTVKRDVQYIPAFRNHLEREGITFEDWQRLNPGPDATSEALALARRRTAQNGRARA